MNTWRAASLVACCLLSACDNDPAQAVRIVSRPPSADRVIPSSTVPVTAAPKDTVPPSAAPPRTPALTPKLAEPEQGWLPEGCPPPPEQSTGPGNLSVTGPCGFRHQAPVSCAATADDLIVAISRQAANGATLMVYLNVEKYAGPGHYDGAQMFIGVQDSTSINRWSSDDVTVTVGEGEAFVVIPQTKLEAEPLLVDCSGPMTNYQCGGRKEATPIENTAEIISGTLRCARTDKPQ